MKLRKTLKGEYTLREEVNGEKTLDAGYKFVKIKSVNELKKNRL